ncbi:MAG: hypothetical protein CL997_05200 [Euryarchaeota archaeon]|nr:hypothetical protein [Euryarchaeota archaeon]
MPGSPYFDDIPKGILTWPILVKIIIFQFVFFILFMFTLPQWWLAVFITLVTISFHIWFATRSSKMLEISSIDS